MKWMTTIAYRLFEIGEREDNVVVFYIVPKGV